MKNIKGFLMVLLVGVYSTSAFAETNTVSSTVVTDKAPPTASAPSIVITIVMSVNLRIVLPCKQDLLVFPQV